MPDHAAGLAKSGKKVNGPAGTASQRATKSNNKGRKTDSGVAAGTSGKKNPDSQGS